jgi:electron transport complex protein RnfD
MIAAGYFFRKYAVILICTCVISAVVTEWFCNLIRKRPSSLDDFSAVVTGIILALSLPPALPVWAAVIGSCFAIGVGKMVFGGLGANIFNPAMVGRAFLTVSFGMLMTSWTVPATIDPAMPKVAPENIVDARTQATPLAWSKLAIKDKAGAQIYNNRVFFPRIVEGSLADRYIGTVELKLLRSLQSLPLSREQNFRLTQVASKLLRFLWSPRVIGSIPGSLGETSVIAALIGGLYLLWRRTSDFHIPVAVLLSSFVFAGIAYLIDSSAYVQPLCHLTSGALLFGAFFIATDPVTAPLTAKGRWIFGVGIGTMTMLIRIAGEYPEGVMYAVLLMNGVRPLIDRFCKQVPAGGKPSA